MKVKSITISGMHKVAKKTYQLNDEITYFVGPNGSGKSTVLEAIQLALLGYIPGYAKTNDSIMRHSSDPIMFVVLELDSGITISRTWMKKGSSSQCTVDIQGYEGELKDLIGEIELPVFDFNEFRSMTANKLKDWFISFLPSSSDGLDIKAELETAANDRAIDFTELLDEAVKWVQAHQGNSDLEVVRGLNAKFKEDQTFVKGQISKLEGTIQSLVYYDEDKEEDEDVVRADLEKYTNLKSALYQYQYALNVSTAAKANLEQLKAELPAPNFESDSRIIEMQDKIKEYAKKNEVIKADYADLVSQIQELMSQKSLLPKAGAVCPYTTEHCDTAAALASSTADKVAEIDKQIAFKQEEMKDCDTSKSAAIDNEIFKLKTEISVIQSKYDKLSAMEIQINSAQVGECPTEMSNEEIDQKIKMCQDKLIHIEANKRYEELSDKVTADKFKLENDLEILKLWIKVTDANGLQTRLMDKPFLDLADEMSVYLSKMFNTDIKAKFNLVAKANSFSFGLEREGNYIEFDYLSSGERCLFTLALILCILNKSKSSIKTILIDDILDHLDTPNASHLFEALKNVNDVQFILAGVKDCEDKNICVSIEE